MLKALIKVQLQSMFSRGLLRGRRSSKKPRNPLLSRLMIVLLALYILASLGISLGVTFHNMLISFQPLNLLWMYFAVAGIAAFLFSVIGSIYLAQASLFSAQDNDLLLSMPIPPAKILVARSVALYLIALSVQAVVLLPALIVYLVFAGFSLPVLVMALIAGLLLPLPTLALSILLGWLLALVSARLRRKNLVVVLLSIAALAAYFVGYSRLIAAMEELMLRGHQIAQAVKGAIPPAYHYGLALAEGKLPSLLLFALFCILPFALVMALVAANYRQVLTTRRGTPKIAYKGGGLKASSLMQALTIKEVRRFFSSPMYMLNAGFSLLFMLGLPIYLAIDKNVLNMFQQELHILAPFLGPAAVGLLSVMAGSVFISSVSISMEGKALWILQSLPVQPIQALLAKAAAHFAISLPVVIAAGIITGLALRLDAFMFASCLLLPLLFTIFSSFLGLILNLRFPKLNWRNETEPVKQSMSPFLAMTLGFLFPLTLSGLGIYLVGKGLNTQLYILLCASFTSLVSGLMYLALKAKADKAFLDLSEV